jgi:hypothetical protein
VLAGNEGSKRFSQLPAECFRASLVEMPLVAEIPVWPASQDVSVNTEIAEAALLSLQIPDELRPQAGGDLS